ncbi:hypothetical protein EV361DRAFT_870145, partial [Lentinula raphanica]
VAQPCDVGIQRPLKLSVKRSYHEDVVNHFVLQLDEGADELTIQKHIKQLRNGTAFEDCKVREWDLSYQSLTSSKIRKRLRDLEETDPALWAIVAGKATNVTEDSNADSNTALPEDHEHHDDGIDDCEVSVDFLVEELVQGQRIQPDGMKLDGIAEQVDAEELELKALKGDTVRGEGKRTIRANTLYSSSSFWRHDPYESDNGTGSSKAKKTRGQAQGKGKGKGKARVQGD